MNNKVLVEIIVPATAQKYDVYIPLDVKMSDVVKMVAKALSDLSEGKYKATDDAILCDAKTGNIFDISVVVAELGINNGSQLILI